MNYSVKYQLGTLPTAPYIWIGVCTCQNLESRRKYKISDESFKNSQTEIEKNQ